MTAPFEQCMICGQDCVAHCPGCDRPICNDCARVVFGDEESMYCPNDAARAKVAAAVWDGPEWQVCQGCRMLRKTSEQHECRGLQGLTAERIARGLEIAERHGLLREERPHGVPQS